MAIPVLPMLLGAAAADYPAQAVLGAFEEACRPIRDYDAALAGVPPKGWEAVESSADPRLGKLAQLGLDAVDDPGAARGAYFRRPVEGRTLYLILSRFQDDDLGYWGNGCRVYDFDAQAPVAEKTLTRWMGKPPTGRQGEKGVLSVVSWEPGWPGVSVTVNNVPQGSDLTEKVGLSGNVLVAQAIGGFGSPAN